MDRNSDIKNTYYTCPVDHSGTDLRLMGWQIVGTDKPPIIIVHDIGENTKLYEELSKTLARSGQSVYAYEMRGHSNKDKNLSFIPSFSQLVNDLLQIVAWVRHEEKGRKPIIVARGMGALIALSLTRAHSKYLKGLVLIAPMFNLMEKPTSFQRFFIKTAADLFPKWKLPKSMTPNFSNSYGDSELEIVRIQPKISGHFAFELLNSVDQSRKILKRLNLPTLMMCPKEDPVLKYEFLKPLVQKHQSPKNFTLKFVEGEDYLSLNSKSEDFHYLASSILSWCDSLLAPKDNKVEANDEIEKEEQATVVVEPPTSIIKTTLHET